MEKLLLIDACIREQDSRTKRIADALIEELKGHFEIERVWLGGDEFQPINTKKYRDREQGIQPAGMEDEAKKLAEADVVMIAAPFWDMSFPAVLKAYVELTSIAGITFIDTPEGTKGGCKAREFIYVTTRGMDIATGSEFEQATPYFNALGFLWGLPKVRCIAAPGMDVLPQEEAEERIITAIEEGKALCRGIING